MSLFKHFEDEAEHVLDILKKAIRHEMQVFGAVNPTSEALLKTVEAHLKTPASMPVEEPVAPVQVAVATPASTEQNVA